VRPPVPTPTVWEHLSEEMFSLGSIPHTSWVHPPWWTWRVFVNSHTYHKHMKTLRTMVEIL
jgi:hypothetical protein